MDAINTQDQPGRIRNTTTHKRSLTMSESEVMPAVDEVSKQEEAPVKMYTEAEVKDMLQREGDRRVNPIAHELKALREQVKALESKNVEAMDETERKRYEIEKRDKELAEREAAIRAAERRRMAVETAARRGWPVDAAGAIEADTQEDIEARAEVIALVARSIADKEVQDRIAKTGGVPGIVGATGSTVKGKITAEQLATMKPEEIAAAFKAGELSHLMGGQK